MSQNHQTPDHHDHSGQTVSLPETVYLIATQSGDDRPHFIKPRNPEGKEVAVAFTDETKAKHFLNVTNTRDPALRIVPLDTSVLLEGLAEAGESVLCINAASEDEVTLNYDDDAALHRRAAPSPNSVKVTHPKVAMEASHVASLARAAAFLPMIQTIWQMDICEEKAEIATRTLLVISFTEGTSTEDQDRAFMSLGMDWCPTLPRGLAVDMMPLQAVPEDAGVIDREPLYRRKE